MENFKLWNFDIDWTLLYLPTKFYYEHKKTWEIHEFEAYEIDQSINRYKREDYLPIFETNWNSRDFFLWMNNHRWFEWIQDDFKRSIEDWKFWPSFELFKTQFLVKWDVFSIITSRWNSPDSFQKSFYMINEETLSQEQKDEQLENIIKKHKIHNTRNRDQILYEYFVNICWYYPCANPTVRKHLWMTNIWSVDRKVVAFNHSIKDYILYLEDLYQKQIREILTNWSKLNISFYEDSVKNSEWILERMKEIKSEWFKISQSNVLSWYDMIMSNEFVWSKDWKKEILQTYSSNSKIWEDWKIITTI